MDDQHGDIPPPRFRTYPVVAASNLELTSLTELLGMAKPMPTAVWSFSGSTAESVGMPTTFPLTSTSAPPLLPGLIGALVWIRSLSATALHSSTVRPSALTIPFVTLLSRPSGLPTARTRSPRRSFDESANVAGGRLAPSTRTTARSLVEEAPTTAAEKAFPDEART